MKHFSMNFKNVPHPGESMELFDDFEDDSELQKAAAQLAWNEKDDEAAN
jgi:hypothetical protein